MSMVSDLLEPANLNPNYSLLKGTQMNQDRKVA